MISNQKNSILNKIILGTAQLGLDYGISNKLGRPSLETSLKILCKAKQSGLLALDTAQRYGNSHQVIKCYNKNHQPFQIYTKFHAPFAPTPNLQEVLEELGVTRVYGLSFHSYEDFKNFDKWDDLLRYKKEGLFRELGVSVYSNHEALELINSEHINFIQIPFNLLDNTYQRNEVFLAARNRKINIHTRSSFLQGLFFLEHDKLPKCLHPLKPYLQKIREISLSYDISIAELAFLYPLCQIDINHVVFGVDSTHQLTSNLAFLGKNLPTELLKEISQIKVLETDLLLPYNWKKT